MLRGWFQSVEPITLIATMLLSFSLLFVFAVAVIFCCRLFCDRADESPAEGASPPPAEPNRPTAPVQAAAEVFHRSSLGRILKPVDDEEAQASLPVSPSCTDASESHSLPLEKPASSHVLNASKTVLSADFGDNEILAVDETACTICLVDFEHGEEIQRNTIYDISGGTTCDHIFHPQCISSWIRKSGKEECPCCRRLFHLETATRRTPISTAEC
jgi:Ring finger domain